MKEALLFLIRKHGITQKELADVLGVTYQTLNLKINGHTEFTRSEILGIKVFFKLTPIQVDYLFFRVEDDEA